jgi:hypothetical protein
MFFETSQTQIQVLSVSAQSNSGTGLMVKRMTTKPREKEISRIMV